MGDIIVSFGYSLSGGERRLVTRAYHSQAGVLMQWEGVAREELLRWFDERADQFLPQPALPPMKLERLDLRQGAREKIQILGCLRFEGSADPDPVIDFRLDFDLEDLATGDTVRVAAEQGTIESGRWVHSFRRDFATPRPGRYQLHATLSTAADSRVVHRMSSGRLRVEA